MKFVKCNGYDEGNYISIEISEVSDDYNQGDMFWHDDKELLVSDFVSEGDIKEWVRDYDVPMSFRKALLGCLRQMGVI